VATSESDVAAAPTADLEDFFENGTVGLHLVAGDGTILRANRADYEPLGYSAEEYVGRSIVDFHADEDVIADILGRLTRGEKLDKYRARLRSKDGSIRHVEISSSVCFREGAFMNTRCFTVDVTDKVAAEEALREAQERLAATYESVVAGIAEVDCEGRFLNANDAFCRMTGYDKDEIRQLSFFDLTHPDDAKGERDQYADLVSGRTERFTIEKRYVRNDGRIIWVQVMNSAVRRSNGEFAFGVKMFQDITTRKEAEARQKLLLDELNHRVKNTLATVQSLAAQTARSCRSTEEFRDRFEPRLLALSAAHDRLTRNQWEGASLKDVVEEELSAHAVPGRTLRVNGPDVMLPPRAALSLSMALHELGTNAAKYGALSVDGGAVEVNWSVERDRLSPKRIILSWTEQGGPAPAPVAARTNGFGSRLLRVTAEELRAAMNVDYAPEGLRWRIDFPVAAS
jgi:PAS domain S-box-containing protein